MTIKDALDYLDNVCVCHGCECLQDHDWGGCYRTTTTGKMACDLRDEAVEVLRKVVFKTMGAAVHYYIESGYKCDIFQELKDLPSAEPEQKWIPVSERLPEDENEVIVTVCDKSGCTPDYYSAIGIYSTHLNCWIVDMVSENVIAWMPLPEPYRGDR